MSNSANNNVHKYNLHDYFAENGTRYCSGLHPTSAAKLFPLQFPAVSSLDILHIQEFKKKKKKN